MGDMPPKLQERDFAGTPYIPVYVMLPVSILIYSYSVSILLVFFTYNLEWGNFLFVHHPKFFCVS